jgi:hypothetical protein
MRLKKNLIGLKSGNPGNAETYEVFFNLIGLILAGG